MKIAQVCPYNFFRGGGAQSHIEFLSRELRKLGHEVKIIAPKIGKADPNRDDIILIGSSTNISFNKTEVEITLALSRFRDPIKELLEKERFDIIHFHEAWTPLLGVQILSESNAVNIGTFHGVAPNTLFGRSLEALFLPYASTVVKALDGVICVSEAAAQYHREFYSGHLYIVPNGIDLKQFSLKAKPFSKYRDGKINILFLGRLDKRKGIMYLMKAFRRIRKKRDDIRLLVAGKGDEFNDVVKYVKKHDIKDVEMLGYIDEKDKARWYATCDIYCSPALYGESFGIVLLEAMALGKPVIGAANSGYKTVLKGRGSLLLVRPKSIDDLVEKISVLADDPDLRKVFGQWGLNEVKQYSWDKIAKQVDVVYQDVIKKCEVEKKNEKQKKKKRGTLSKWISKLTSL